jgi:hypothetical protein
LLEPYSQQLPELDSYWPERVVGVVIVGIGMDLFVDAHLLELDFGIVVVEMLGVLRLLLLELVGLVAVVEVGRVVVEPPSGVGLESWVAFDVVEIRDC